MGLTIFYQAIPEQSSLFTLLSTDAAAYWLFSDFFNRGNGPFFLAELEDEEVSDVLEHLAQSPNGQQVFGTQQGAAKALASLDWALQEAKEGCPGIEQRAAILEKIDEELFDCLSPHFEVVGGKDALALLRVIIEGDEQALRPAGLAESSYPLGLVSADLVQQAGRLLQALTPERVLAGVDEDTADVLLEDYEQWRNVYLQAVQHKEAMLVGF